MAKMDIYIGLNDMEEKKQKFDNSKYISVLKNVCLNYNVPFSFHLIEGGYIHNSGEYIQENTLIVDGIILCRKMAKKNVVFPTYFFRLNIMV